MLLGIKQHQTATPVLSEQYGSNCAFPDSNSMSSFRLAMPLRISLRTERDASFRRLISGNDRYLIARGHLPSAYRENQNLRTPYTVFFPARYRVDARKAMLIMLVVLHSITLVLLMHTPYGNKPLQHNPS